VHACLKRVTERTSCQKIVVFYADAIDWLNVSEVDLMNGELASGIDQLVEPIRQLLEEAAMSAPPIPPQRTQRVKVDNNTDKNATVESPKHDATVEDDEGTDAFTGDLLDFEHMHDCKAKPYQSSDSESYGDEDLHIDLDESGKRKTTFLAHKCVCSIAQTEQHAHVAS